MQHIVTLHPRYDTRSQRFPKFSKQIQLLNVIPCAYFVSRKRIYIYALWCHCFAVKRQDRNRWPKTTTEQTNINGTYWQNPGSGCIQKGARTYTRRRADDEPLRRQFPAAPADSSGQFFVSSITFARTSARRRTGPERACRARLALVGLLVTSRNAKCNYRSLAPEGSIPNWTPIHNGASPPDWRVKDTTWCDTTPIAKNIRPPPNWIWSSLTSSRARSSRLFLFLLSVNAVCELPARYVTMQLLVNMYKMLPAVKRRPTCRGGERLHLGEHRNSRKSTLWTLNIFDPANASLVKFNIEMEFFVATRQDVLSNICMCVCILVYTCIQCMYILCIYHTYVLYRTWTNAKVCGVSGLRYCSNRSQVSTAKSIYPLCVLLLSIATVRFKVTCRSSRTNFIWTCENHLSFFLFLYFSWFIFNVVTSRYCCVIIVVEIWHASSTESFHFATIYTRYWFTCKIKKRIKFSRTMRENRVWKFNTRTLEFS